MAWEPSLPQPHSAPRRPTASTLPSFLRKLWDRRQEPLDLGLNFQDVGLAGLRIHSRQGKERRAGRGPGRRGKGRGAPLAPLQGREAAAGFSHTDGNHGQAQHPHGSLPLGQSLSLSQAPEAFHPCLPSTLLPATPCPCLEL